MRTSARRCAVTKKRVPRAAAWWGRSGTATASAGGPKNALQAGLKQADTGVSTGVAHCGSPCTPAGAGRHKHSGSCIDTKLHGTDGHPFRSAWQIYAEQLRLAASSFAVRGLHDYQASSGPLLLSQQECEQLRPEIEYQRQACTCQAAQGDAFHKHVIGAAFIGCCSPETQSSVTAPTAWATHGRTCRGSQPLLDLATGRGQTSCSSRPPPKLTAARNKVCRTHGSHQAAALQCRGPRKRRKPGPGLGPCSAACMRTLTQAKKVLAHAGQARVGLQGRTGR